MATDPVDALILIYQEAVVELLTRLSSKSARGNSTAYERALLADVVAILTELDTQARAWIETQLPLVYLNGMSEAVRQLTLAGVLEPGFQTSFAGVNRAAVEVLAANLYGDLSDARSVVGRHVDDVFRQAGLQAVTTKVSTGQTVKEAQRNLRQLLAEQGIVGFTDARGRQWRLDTYAAMVVRTTTAEATNRGTLDQLTTLGYDLVRITEHTPTCPICAPYQGRIFSISGNDPRFPPLFGTAFGVAHATIHPNCRHRVSPWIEALATPDEKRAALTDAEKPFDVDPRTQAEREAYDRGVAQKRQMRADRRQWEDLTALLPNDAPTTFAGYRRMKRANSERYQELQGLAREARRQISATA